MHGVYHVRYRKSNPVFDFILIDSRNFIDSLKYI